MNSDKINSLINLVSSALLLIAVLVPIIKPIFSADRTEAEKSRIKAILFAIFAIIFLTISYVLMVKNVRNFSAIFMIGWYFCSVNLFLMNSNPMTRKSIFLDAIYPAITFTFFMAYIAFCPLR